MTGASFGSAFNFLLVEIAERHGTMFNTLLQQAVKDSLACEPVG